jgi:tetratricopeptide (TPR) repeat protein
MRYFTYLGNIFLLSMGLSFPLAYGNSVSTPSDNGEHETHYGQEKRAIIGQHWREALVYIREEKLDQALPIYEELVHQRDFFTVETYAKILGQYVWLRLQLSSIDQLTHFLLLRIQTEPELLCHLSTWEALWNVLHILSSHRKFEKALQFFQNVKAVAVNVEVPSEEVSIYNLFIEMYLLLQCHYTCTSYMKAKELLERYHFLQDPSFREHIHSCLLLYLGELEMLMEHETVGLLYLKILREHFPKTFNDMRSRIFLAEWYETHGLIQEAREILEEPMGQDSQSPHPFKPQLLYALSRQTCRQGFKFYSQAIDYLEIIAHTYLRSEFYVPAKLLEGELLRELHHFFGAQLLYEDLLKKSALSPSLKTWIQLLRIRCILALHPDEHTEKEKAISLLSSIVDTPQLPRELRAEIQFLQTLLLFENDHISEARQVINQVITNFTSNTVPLLKERYWLKRIISIAQRIAKSENDAEREQKLLEISEHLQL